MTLGIDIGASKTLGILLDDGEIIKTEKGRTDSENTLDFILEFAKNLAADNKPEAVGLSVAGVVDASGSKVLAVGNLYSLPGLPVQERLEEAFKAPVYMDNDGACFIWAEFLQGAAQSAKSAVGLTLGTGVGGGYVLECNGKPFLFHGAHGSNFEVGHTIIKAGGAKCGCGQKGCLEAYASSHFFMRQAGISAKTASKRAREGDRRAKKLYTYYGHWLGIGIANFINLLDPEVIVIGGGIASAWDLFMPQAKKEIKKHVLSPASRKPKIKRAQLGYRAPAMGAALLSRS